MKTFFHPAATVEENPAILRLWSFLRERSGDFAAVISPAVRRVLPLARKHPKVALYSVIGVGSAMFAGLGGADGMPGVAKADRKSLPAAVEESAREVFDGRFVKHGDSYYTVKVSYYHNIADQMTDLMATMMGAQPSPDAKGMDAPLIATMELIEIKGLHTTVLPEKLTTSDKLNNTTWRGQIHIKGEAERRRKLDLTAWLKQAASENPEAPMPWIETAITLHPSIISSKSSAATNDMNAFAEMTKLFIPDQKEELLNALKQGAWMDWGQCDDRVYQSSTLQARGSAVTSSTLESIELSFPDDHRHVSLIACYSGSLAHMISASEENLGSFLTKPDIKTLRKAGLLK